MLELIGILVVLVEAVIESVKMFVEEFAWELVASFALGAGGSVLFGINLFEVLGVELAFNGLLSTILSAILLGLFFVRYSGVANGLLDFIKEVLPKTG
jgi:hypothetical protein